MTKDEFAVIITGMGTAERGDKGGIGQRCAAQQESPPKGDSYCNSNAIENRYRGGIAPPRPWRFWEAPGPGGAVDKRKRLGPSRRKSEPPTAERSELLGGYSPGQFRLAPLFPGKEASYDD